MASQSAVGIGKAEHGGHVEALVMRVTGDGKISQRNTAESQRYRLPSKFSLRAGYLGAYGITSI